LSAYALLKWLHVATALISLALFTLRALLTLTNRPWRNSVLRWAPHVNDTVLLAAAFGLSLLTGWMPLVHHWLTLKILLLLGYIAAGREALKVSNSKNRQLGFSAISLALVLSIFALAFGKPF